MYRTTCPTPERPTAHSQARTCPSASRIQFRVGVVASQDCRIRNSEQKTTGNESHSFLPSLSFSHLLSFSSYFRQRPSTLSRSRAAPAPSIQSCVFFFHFY